jgi:hypothetical protein
MEITHEQLHLGKRSLVQLKISDMAINFAWINIFLTELLNTAMVGLSALLRWMQNLHQSTGHPEILYADRSSKDEQLKKHFREKPKIRTWRASKG